MKMMAGFLALMFLMYSIVSFIYKDPATGATRPPPASNVAKGLIYLIVSIIIGYFVVEA
jgi:hypothetical protein